MNVALLKKINKKHLPQKYLFPPKWIVLGVNNVCNLHCKMCDVGTQSLETNFAQNLVGTSPLNMPLDLLKNIIDNVAEYYPSAKLGYAFTEPLVYPHLAASLKYAKEKNVKTQITTNALTLKQKAKILVENGIDEISISLDGPQDIHNEIRGHKKSFQKAIEGIEEVFRLNKNISVSVFCVITEWNIGYLKEFLDFFKKYPLNKIGFMHTNFTLEDIANTHNNIWSESYPATVSNIEEVNVDNFNLDVLWDEMQEIKKSEYPFAILFSPEVKSKEKLIEFYHQPQKLIGKRCDDVFENIMIKSDGSVIPSHGRCYNLTLGNIHKESLKEIWHSHTLKKLRTDLHSSGGLFPACSRCCSAF